MKATLIICGLAVTAQLLAFGCHQSSPSIKGNSNWLKVCTNDNNCGSGDCVCGVCTWACEDDAQCDDNTQCVQPSRPGIDSDCAETSSGEPDLVCLGTCQREDDCRRGFRCVEGACVRTAVLNPQWSTPDAFAPIPDGDQPACSGDETVALVSERQQWTGDGFGAPARSCMVVQGPYGVVGCSESRSLLNNDLREYACPERGLTTVEVLSEDEELVLRQYSCEFLRSGQRDVFEFTTFAGERQRHTYHGTKNCDDRSQ